MKKELFFMMLLVVNFLSTSSSCSANTPTDSTSIVLNNISTRVSVRRFTNQPVSKEMLETIVRAGMAAPSAHNKQPWEFVIVTERDMLDSLKRYHPYANLETAPAAIVVCGNLNNAVPDYEDFWIQDCSAASQNILLAAHALGLGAVWCCVLPDMERVPQVARVLGLPQKVIPLNIITMGYPSSLPQPKDKWKPEKIHYQCW